MEEQAKPQKIFYQSPNENVSNDGNELTTRQLLREMNSLKELFKSDINRIDTSIEVAHADLTRVPTDVQKAVGTLKELTDEKLKGLDKIYDLHVRHLTYISELKSKHQVELDAKESVRLDAIRQVDQSTVKTEAERAGTAVQVLANTAITTAETLRNSVTQSATTLANQFEKIVGGMGERVTNLEKSSYLGAGKAGVTDPTIQKMAESIDLLLRSQSQIGGEKQGKKETEVDYAKYIGWIIALISLGYMLLNK